MWHFCWFLLACSLIQVKTDCVPDPVFYIYLENATLSWNESKNCKEIEYIVTIIEYSNAGIIEFNDRTNSTVLDISFLPYCNNYVFTICAISRTNNLIGPYSQIAGYIPLPEGSVISITNITAYQYDRDVILDWHVLPEYKYCPDSYRLLLWNEDSTEPEKISVKGGSYYFISQVAQCMRYRIEISVQRSSEEYPLLAFNYTVPSATNRPSLESVSQTAVTINITWSLEGYSMNRCKVSNLLVTGTAYNASIPYVDSPERPNIDVFIQGLRTDSMYYFNVTIENEAGISEPYQLAVQTLPVQLDQELHV